jgi:hypothetical protein
MKINATITFDKGYIAHPYWPELEKAINIEKESGTRRARSEEKRVKALRDYLTSHNMTMEDYLALKQKAERPFYTVATTLGTVNGHQLDEIVIPSHQLYGALAQACDLASSSLRIAKTEQLRTVLTVDDIFTGKDKADGVWDRFVVVKAGAGQKLSNQRALRSNAYLGPFTADWGVSFSEEILNVNKVKDFLQYAGREIGVGASRKLGWGRFSLTF